MVQEVRADAGAEHLGRALYGLAPAIHAPVRASQCHIEVAASAFGLPGRTGYEYPGTVRDSHGLSGDVGYVHGAGEWRCRRSQEQTVERRLGGRDVGAGDHLMRVGGAVECGDQGAVAADLDQGQCLAPRL